MNRFRMNLHQSFLEKKVEVVGDGEPVIEQTKEEEAKLTQEIITEKQGQILNLTEYLIKRDKIEFKNKNFENMYNDLLVKENRSKPSIEIKDDQGNIIDRDTLMDYVLAMFFYYHEEGKTELGEQELGELRGNAETMKKFYQLFLENQSEVEKQNEKKKTQITRKNNESLTSLTKPIDQKKEAKEKEKMDKAKTDKEKEKQLKKQRKELAKQLDQLARNKKIDFPWTDNEWKCSDQEAELGESCAKVFQQLLDQGCFQRMIDLCKSHTGELTKEKAKQRQVELGINSKERDIQNFYKSYQEYQNSQLGFQHLINLMDFFCTSGFEKLDDVRQTLKEQQSLKISKKDIKKYPKGFTQGDWYRKENGEWTYMGSDSQKRRGKPEDWKERVSFEIIKNRLGEESSTDKMLTLLGDFNLDGEVNSGDVGYRTGTQLLEVFRRIVATQKLNDSNFSDDKAVQNLVAYANKFGKNIKDVSTVSDLYTWMTKPSTGYDNTRKLQNFIKDLPIELGDVLRNGADAGTEFLQSIAGVYKLEAQEREKAMAAAKEKAQEFVDKNEKLFNERIKDAGQRANITQQLLTQLPGVLMQQAQEQGKGFSIGAAIPLDEVIKGFSLGFKLGLGEDGKPSFGIYGAYDHKFNLGKGASLSTGGSLGVNTFFIPCGSLFVEFGYDVNEEKRKETLKAMGINEIKLGANCTMYGPIFSRGVSAGFEQNKQGGIEKQARKINGQLKSIASDLVDAITNNPEKQHEAIYEKLREKRPKSSKEELDRATTNILQIVSQFKIDDKTDLKDKNIYAQIIADVYTDIWRNESLSGIADNKTKLSGGKVGVQFLAGFLPIPSLVLKFTKYYNARTDETEYSKAARVDAQVNGTGNRIVELNSKEIGETHVAQLNEILKRYGAKTSLTYQAGEDGKPGRIRVPASIADGIGINIRVSKSLKGYVKYSAKKDGEVYYDFPANATYRLLQETGGNQRSVTLNIGSDRNSDSDVSISNSTEMQSLDGDGELMGEKKLEYGDPRSETIEHRPADIDSLFTTDVIEGLKTVDSSNRKKFSAFMKTKRDAIDDFNDMLVALKNVLGKNRKYEDIVNKLNDESVSKEDKQLIIDRIMAYSAYANVHDKKGLNQNVKHRGNYYKKESMKGSNGQSIFDKLSVKRDDILPEIQNYNSVFKPNLLGATAFYHRNNTAKGLALTGLGATNVLGGTVKPLEDNNDKLNAEKWFMGGENDKGDYVPGVLEKAPTELANIKRVLKSKLPDGVDFKDKDLKELLKGNEITIDNSQKNVKVKLDVKYVFYLMGECANESVGMELGNLTIQEQEEVDDYRSGQLIINDGDRSNSVSIRRDDKAFGGSLNLGEKGGEEKPEFDDGSNPSNGKPGTIPGHQGEPIGGGNGGGNGNGSDNLLTTGGKSGGDGPNHNNDGNL